jgi:uncharacterized protein
MKLEGKKLLKKYVERFKIDFSLIGYLNLMNGSVFVDNKYKSKSIQDFFNKCSKKEKKELEDMEFLNKDSEEKIVKEYLINLKRKKENLVPECIIFILGFECNFNCPYCTPENYKLKYGKNSVAKTKEINLKKAFQIIKSNKYLLEGAKNQINFYGGEPFLNFKKRKEQVKEIFKELKKIKPKMVLIPTNGFEINRFKKEFKILTDNNIPLTLQITIDGPPQTHNLTRRTWDKKDTFNRITKKF